MSKYKLRLPPVEVLLRQGLALGIGLIAGLIAWKIGMPLPWMLGPMIGCTIAALSGAPIAAPKALRSAVITIIGVMLGSGFHPGLGEQLGQWSTTFLILPGFLLVGGAASFVYYRKLGGYDPITACFSSAPGGLNEMMLLGAEAGGDERKIALAHATRVLAVIAMIALFFGLVLGITSSGNQRSYTAMNDLILMDYAIMIGCCVIGYRLAPMLRLPAPGLLGPMILSGIAHWTELVTLPPPTLLVTAAQITLGTTIGARFIGTRVSEIARDLLLGVGSAVVLLSATLSFAFLLTLVTDTPITQAFLAYSPGGLTEMSLLALALGQDVAYVAVTHVVRISIVIAAAPFVFRLVRTRLSDTD